MPFKDIKVIDLVDSNYTYASVLSFLGIKFYEYPDQTLAEACEDLKLCADSVIASLQRPTVRFDHPQAISKLRFCSLDVILSYLKKAHRYFIRYKLPFMQKLVCDVQPEFFDCQLTASSLKFSFPLFMEDFIHHIRDEENSLFKYVEKLQKVESSHDCDLHAVFSLVKNNSLQEMASHHESEDDEMKGIRELTNNYFINSNSTTYTKVIYSELKEFESSLRVHANVENQILFPKAISLEQNVFKFLSSMSKKN